MLRDLALLLVNRVTDQRKRIYFLVNVPPPEAFSAQNALNIVWRPGFAGPAGGAYSAPQTLDGFKGRTSKGRGGEGGVVK